jgi:hypothetical protein
VEQAPSQLPGAAGTAPPVQTAVAPQSTRLLFIDNLRILLISLVLNALLLCFLVSSFIRKIPFANRIL